MPVFSRWRSLRVALVFAVVASTCTSQPDQAASFAAVTAKPSSSPTASPSPAPPTEIVVSTILDAANGDVSSPGALIAHPPPEGISLREAILATNNAGGTPRITFSPALAGQTLTPETFLPFFERDGVSLVGLIGDNGQPAITVDGSKVHTPGLLNVRASGVSIQRLRFARFATDAIHVLADAPGGPKVVRNVRIEDNVFDNDGATSGFGLLIGMLFPGIDFRTRQPYPGAVDATVSAVVVARNTFRRLAGAPADAINVQNVGTNGTIEDLVVQRNVFSDLTSRGEPAVELDNTLTNNRILRTQIIGNTFTASWRPIGLNGAIGYPDKRSSGNVISDTVISGNEFRGNQFGIGFTAGGGNATGNSILNTEISNNLMTGSAGAVDISGGADGATANRVDGVRIANNTIAYNDSGILVRADRDRATGNQVSGVEIRDTILWMNGQKDFFGVTGITPQQVFSSVTSAPGFASVNGNISADPLFVDSAQGDFRLKPGSLAAGIGYKQ